MESRSDSGGVAVSVGDGKVLGGGISGTQGSKCSVIDAMSHYKYYYGNPSRVVLS